MAKFVDLSGQKFGKLLLIERIPQYKGGRPYYKCKCECGNEKIIDGYEIKRGHVKSCGCSAHTRTTNAVNFDDNFAYIYVSGLDNPVIIDIEDYEKVKQYHWNKTPQNYIYTNIYSNGDGTHTALLIHRLIMGLDFGNKLCVDHIDGNTFDNRKCNLRIVNKMQNNWNKTRPKNKSGMTGVCKNSNCSTWQSNININHKKIHLGNFKSFEDAVKARIEAEKKYFGEYRRDYEDNNAC